MAYIIAVPMQSSAHETPRTIYCVCLPSGRIVAERLTRAGAERALARLA